MSITFGWCFFIADFLCKTLLWLEWIKCLSKQQDCGIWNGKGVSIRFSTMGLTFLRMFAKYN